MRPVRMLLRAKFFRPSFCVACAAVIPLSPSSPQNVGRITGSITDSAGIPLVGGELIVDGTSLRAQSDDNGEFRMADVPVGPVIVRARRLGFTPSQVRVEVPSEGTATVAFRLVPVASMLAPVVVRADRVNYTGRLAGYYQRLEKKAGGYFITREQIDRENPQMLKQLLVQHVPAITEVRGRGHSSGIRMRGRTCWPLVWLDGIPMPAGEVDLDSFAPQSIQGIELYLGSTTAPARYIFTRDASSCGTILLWSRGPDTDPIHSESAPVSDLERLVASSAVFTPDQVDRQATLDPEQPLELSFPPALFAEGIRGLVVAEFVVDTVGHIEGSTIGLVSSTHPLFSDAVRLALGRATYLPALRDGRAVRQIVQQPFDFVVNRQLRTR